MKVFTYFTHLPGGNPELATKLLVLWRQNWMAHGFESVVLSEYHATQHELYEPFCRRIEALPSVNPPEYEKACYLRYLAMCVAGGGLMTDHDLFCYDCDFSFGKKPDKLISYQMHVPCLLYGNKRAYEAAALGIMNYKVTEKDLIESSDGRPHVSDMYMFLRGGIEFTSRTEVKNFGEPGWEKAPFVHYSNGSMKPAAKYPRHLHVRKLRNW